MYPRGTHHKPNLALGISAPEGAPKDQPDKAVWSTKLQGTGHKRKLDPTKGQVTVKGNGEGLSDLLGRGEGS